LGRAQGLSKEILKEFPDTEVKLEVGNSGQFDVIYESDPPALLFSKNIQRPKRFPYTGEVIEKLKQEKQNG